MDFWCSSFRSRVATSYKESFDCPRIHVKRRLPFFEGIRAKAELMVVSRKLRQENFTNDNIDERKTMSEKQKQLEKALKLQYGWKRKRILRPKIHLRHRIARLPHSLETVWNLCRASGVANDSEGNRHRWVAVTWIPRSSRSRSGKHFGRKCWDSPKWLDAASKSASWRRKISKKFSTSKCWCQTRTEVRRKQTIA